MNRWRMRGRYWEPERRLSVLELVKFGTLDLKLASLLWLMMEQRASVLVAAGPSFAGKTTMLNVLLDFLRPEIKEVRLSGYGEDFSFVKTSSASGTYLVAEEFSDYGDYVWGQTAHVAFQLLTEGYALGGTIHARTPREVVYVLHEYLGLSIETIAHIDLIVTLGVAHLRGQSDPVRRVESLSLFVPVDNKTGIQTLGSNELGGGSFAILDDSTLRAALSKRFPIGAMDVSQAMQQRQSILEKLVTNGKLTRDQVRAAVLKFYA